MVTTKRNQTTYKNILDGLKDAGLCEDKIHMPHPQGGYMVINKLEEFAITTPNNQPLPLHTDVKCFHCVRDITGIPWPEPIRFIKQRDGISKLIVREVLYCSPSCVKTQLRNGRDSYNRMQLLFYMAKSLFGCKNIDKINDAPNRALLGIFTPGGLTHEQFHLKTLQCQIDKIPHGLLLIPPEYQESFHVDKYQKEFLERKRKLESTNKTVTEKKKKKTTPNKKLLSLISAT